MNDVSEKLKVENAKMKELLRWIAYPRRGTEESNWDIQDAANVIQNNFTLEELQSDS